MSILKKIIFPFFIIIISGCAAENGSKISFINEKKISIESPNDKYNILFKEYLKRKFNSEKILKSDYILKTNISFNSSETLSVSGSTVLNSTKAIIEYTLIDNNSNTLLRSGSIKTFPALSSSSNSLYSNEKSLEHIKERLSLSAANKLYLLTTIILKK